LNNSLTQAASVPPLERWKKMATINNKTTGTNDVLATIDSIPTD
jgi:hypothetical protein